MTEVEWLSCSDPRAMYAFVKEALAPRQRQRFAIACGRRHCRIFEKGEYRTSDEEEYWLRMKMQIDRLCTRAIDAAEEMLGGAERSREIETLRKEVFELGPLGLNWDLTAALTGDVPYWVKRLELPTSTREQASLDGKLLNKLHEEALFQANLFREIVGNPFSQSP